MTKRIFVTIVCLLFIYENLFAWGRNGHTIVLSLAYQNLTPANKEIFLKYLNGISIADAASWMDEIKGEAQYDNLRKLHYINLNNGAAYRQGSNDNIVDELRRILNELKSPKGISDSAMRINLLELYHLVGDIHQPYHTIGEDKGGNDYQVQFNGKGTNLHKVWDSEIIAYANIKLSDVELLKLASSKNLDVLDWLTESRSIAYEAYPSNHKITDEYIKQYTNIIKQQLNIAGLRLAAILNKYLGDLNPSPVFVKEAVDVAEISIDSVNSWYKGKTVKICTKIYSTKQIESGSKPLLLSVGAEYPYNVLTVVIFNEDLSTFKLDKEKDYKKKHICVTGKIVEYQGKLQIVVKKEEQIEIK
jgi:hypothetical protein